MVFCAFFFGCGKGLIAFVELCSCIYNPALGPSKNPQLASRLWVFVRQFFVCVVVTGETMSI